METYFLPSLNGTSEWQCNGNKFPSVNFQVRGRWTGGLVTALTCKAEHVYQNSLPELRLV